MFYNELNCLIGEPKGCFPVWFSMFFFTCSSIVSSGTSPSLSLSRCSYNVPPSVQILRRVKAVAAGLLLAYASFSSSLSFSRLVVDTSHFSPVCFWYSSAISAGVQVKELTIKVAFREDFGASIAATTSFPTLHAYQQKEANLRSSLLSHRGERHFLISCPTQYRLFLRHIKTSNRWCQLHRTDCLLWVISNKSSEANKQQAHVTS